MKVYTRKGDDGTTGLLYGGRVAKTSAWPAAYGDVDEAQSAIGVARAAVAPDDELATMLVGLERDLWVVMAELATDPANRHKLQAGASLATAEMVTALETLIDDVSERFDPPTEFVIPGETVVAAHLDLARAVVRRAERSVLHAFATAGSDVPPSECLPYLNRLSDLLWTLARWQEKHSLTSRDA